MSDDPLIERLFAEEDRLTREVVDGLLRRPELRGRLLEISRDRTLWDGEPPGCWAPVHATIVLSAAQPAVGLEELLPALDLAYEFADDLIEPWAPSILAQAGLEAVRAILHDPARDPFLRQDAATALVAAPATRASAAEELRAVARDSGAPKDLRALCASHLLGMAEARDREFLLGFPTNDFFDRDYVAEVYETGARAPFPPLEDPLSFYDEEERKRRREAAEEHGADGPDLDEIDPEEIVRTDPAGDVLDAAAADPDLPAAPFRRAEAKVGRNDPCPCGSGAKFKKCCGR